MKSKISYDMHNYAATISPSAYIGDAVNTNDEEITKTSSTKIPTTKTNTQNANVTNEKYSLRQRQKRRITSALAIVNDSPGYASDENNNQTNSHHEQERVLTSGYTQKTTTTKAKTKLSAAKRKKIDNNSHDFNAAFQQTIPTSAMTTASPTTTSQPQSTSSSPPKAKTKAAPLSKYRRKTANARERTRMREINSAFENLRHCVPHTITGDDASQSNEKLTKITTLRLAMKYISILTEALANPEFGEDFLQECKRDGDHRFMAQPPVGYTPSQLLPQYDELDDELEAMQQVVKKSKSQTKTKTKTTKGNATPATARGNASIKKKSAAVGKMPASSSKRQAKKKSQQSYADAYSSAASTCSSHSTSSSVASVSSSSSSSSAYATLSSMSSAASSIAGGSPQASSAFLLDSPVSAAYMHNMVSVHQSMSDLSSLMLESDGESMQLSEPCLSPLQSGYHLLGGKTTHSTLTGASSTGTSTAALSPYDTSSSTAEHINLPTLENPLELSLRLLDSSADSLDFNVTTNSDGQHAPSTCISPLVTLDTFNPFADLLHSDFSEQNTLDLFLA